MENATAKKRSAAKSNESLLAKFKVMGKKIHPLEKELPELRQKLEAPKDWRNAVGMLKDPKVSHEADALGREFRKKQPEF